MSNEKFYRFDEVCKELGVSTHTLAKWYQWERYSMRDGIVSEKYLPQPKKLENERGKPKIWTQSQVEQLKEYHKTITVGRNGKYGRYTNPLHKEAENE